MTRKEKLFCCEGQVVGGFSSPGAGRGLLASRRHGGHGRVAPVSVLLLSGTGRGTGGGQVVFRVLEVAQDETADKMHLPRTSDRSDAALRYPVLVRYDLPGAGASRLLARRRRLPRPPRRWVRRTGARSTATPVQLSCQIFWSGYLSRVTKGTRGELESPGSKSGVRNLQGSRLAAGAAHSVGSPPPRPLFPCFLHCTVFNLL